MPRLGRPAESGAPSSVAVALPKGAEVRAVSVSYKQANEIEVAAAKAIREDSKLIKLWARSGMAQDKLVTVAAWVATLQQHLVAMTDAVRGEINDRFLQAIEEFAAAARAFEHEAGARLDSLNDTLEGLVNAPTHWPHNQKKGDAFDVRHIERLDLHDYLLRLHDSVNEGDYLSRDPFPTVATPAGRTASTPKSKAIHLTLRALDMVGLDREHECFLPIATRCVNLADTGLLSDDGKRVCFGATVDEVRKACTRIDPRPAHAKKDPS